MKEYCLLFAFLAMTPLMFAQSKEQGVPEVKKMKPALLVIDIQNCYLPMMAQDEKDLALRMINGAIWLFRQHEMPVIRVYHSDPQFGPDPGDEDFEFPSSVIIKEDDPKIIKNYPSAFKKTDLDRVLHDKKINTVFLCGLSAVGCVLATYFGASERDYAVFMVRDAIMSHNRVYTDLVGDITDVVNFNTLQFMLEHMQK